MGAPYRFGRFTLDPVESRLSADGVVVPLGPTAFRLLLTLVESAGDVVTKDDLLSRVWNRAIVGDHVLHVHINTLRKALGGDCIVNKHGYGYRFVPPARQLEVPPPSQARRRLGNLPAPFTVRPGEGPTRLIGRSALLRTVSELLDRCRLVTLTGHGGVGKTRLALEAAHDASPQFQDGAWLVELATLSNSDLVADTITTALGIKVGANATPLSTLSRYLARRSLLIVLDNCEHLIAAAASISESLLAASPRVKILATSREVLSCAGEQVLEVPPLALPDEAPMQPDRLRSIAAIELFVERATGANANFRIGDEELPTVARICRRVDGLPLALEMVASWASLLGLEALDGKLEGSLDAWLRARATAPMRHSTLRATLEWSHALLSVSEQTVLRRLAVFAGSFTMDAAEAVAGDEATAKELVFESVAGLIRKSMIAVVPSSGVQRYRLLDTTRAFMLEWLAVSRDSHAARGRHARYVLSMLEKAGFELETTGDAIWLERYGRMLDDLRAALDWAMGEDTDDAVALAGASWPLWRQLSLRTEGRQRLSGAAARLRPHTPPALEARLRCGLGDMLSNTVAVKSACEEIQRAASLYRALGDLPHLGQALTTAGHPLIGFGRIEEAEEAVLEALPLLEPQGWLRTLATAQSTLLCVHGIRGRFAAARVAGEKAARLCEMAGADRTAIVTAANLVQVSLLEGGDIDGIISASRNLAARLRDPLHSDLRGYALGVLVAALTARGDLNGAVTAAREAVPLLRDEGMLFWLFDHLALRAVLAGRAQDAALIAGYATAVSGKFGRPREPTENRAIERMRRMLRDRLPAEEIAQLDGMGVRLSEDQVIGIALTV
ncbi:MAG: ATP-binding protein [Rhizomicrobium sp.]